MHGAAASDNGSTLGHFWQTLTRLITDFDIFSTAENENNLDELITVWFEG